MGHKLDETIFKTDLWKKYLCPKCRLVLKDAVQPSCGHWLCQSCADVILAPENENLPVCPRDDCGEELTAEDGIKYFPDRFVRKEILSLPIVCSRRDRGCNWEGKFSELEDHQKECQYGTEKCEHCGLLVGDGELEAHKSRCPEQCPCVVVGTISGPMRLAEHLHTGIVAPHYGCEEVGPGGPCVAVGCSQTIPVYKGLNQPATTVTSLINQGEVTHRAVPVSFLEYLHVLLNECKKVADIAKTSPPTPQENLPHHYYQPVQLSPIPSAATPLSQHFTALDSEAKESMSEELKKREEEITSLRTSLTTLTAKFAEIEDRDFRSYDGTMLWKIPQFSQRMADAQNGKYTSIFSLPFYTDRYGYKMCLRLYMLGDGVGNNNYVSLFFVIMQGEFDNILPWPFSHKVTFRLINQVGGRDIIDTFQPDPISSSFKKPKSDMNVASGCPRFVSHHDLKNSGFIVDDTIFIKCVIDRTTIKKP